MSSAVSMFANALGVKQNVSEGIWLSHGPHRHCFSFVPAFVTIQFSLPSCLLLICLSKYNCTDMPRKLGTDNFQKHLSLLNRIIHSNR